MSFDCGITNPSIIIAREMNSWTWIYCPSINLAHHACLINGANQTLAYTWDNHIQVNASKVPLIDTTAGRQIEWIAIL